MSYQETACLVLKTNNLTTYGTTNAYGSGNRTLASFTWTNINLRTLLGDIFDKYDRYLLLLQNISHAKAGDFVKSGDQTADANNRGILINMSGLSFVNSTYIQKLQSSSGALIVCPFIFVSNNVQSQLYNNFAVSAFIEQNDIFNIGINYNIINYDSASTSVTYPHAVYIFNIVGLEEYRIKNVMNNRLLK
jgi:hypothetical protein